MKKPCKKKRKEKVEPPALPTLQELATKSGLQQAVRYLIRIRYQVAHPRMYPPGHIERHVDRVMSLVLNMLNKY